MKHFFTLLLLFTGSICAFSQSVITRVSSGQSYFYYGTLNNAQFIQSSIDEAENGDTIYLPGGLFKVNSSNVVINKQLVIFGAGIHPDSTGVTGKTILETSGGWKVLFTTGAHDVEIHGISFTKGSVPGSVQVTNAVDGLTFVRCDFNLLYLGSTTGDYNSLVSNLLIQECVINDWVFIDGATNALITNSVVKAMYYAKSSITVQNCLFLDFDQNNITYNSGVIYKNNIFTRDFMGTYNVTELSTFQNNLWILKPSGIVTISGVPLALPNRVTTNMTNVFVTAPSYTDFNFSTNYDLKPATIYKTMGTDGKEVGFYGSSNPLKKGFHPLNPHWQQLDIPSGTSGGVMNNVIIKASAQNN